MPSFAELLSQGATNAWLFVPTAIVLGALHGLEPGHSKTMMAAFIIAIRGSVAQAVLLGLAATASHTAIVWIIALGGVYLWRGIAPEAFEPWLQLVSGLIILAMSIWMLWRVKRSRQPESARRGHEHSVPHEHGHHHEHPHGHENLHEHGHAHHHGHHHHDHYHHGHQHHGHDHHTHSHEENGRTAPLHDALTEDAHARAHAEQIRRYVNDRRVTNWQILVFGLTGGLIPCPAAITVLLLCLQVREFTLGAALVLCFSIGLAITLVSVGAAAALSLRYASRRMSWLSELAVRAPYFSGVLMAVVGLYVAAHGALVLMR